VKEEHKLQLLENNKMLGERFEHAGDDIIGEERILYIQEVT
jgi:hypothetical protein